MAKNTKAFVQDFAFYEQLWEYYSQNRGKIRSRYNDLLLLAITTRVHRMLRNRCYRRWYMPMG